METWKQEIYERYSSGFGRSVTEDSYTQYIPMAKHIIVKCLPANKDIRIADIGCGKGGFIKVFLNEGYKHVIGIDVSDEEVGIAHQFGLHQVVQSELFEWFRSAGDQSYDVLLFLDVVEHFSRQDLIRMLKEAFRLLSPKGRIIIHVPNAEGIFGNRIRYADITHEQAFTVNSLSQVCRHVGFSEFEGFEDKPIVHNLTSLIRRTIWEMFTLPVRLLFAAETGTFQVKLSQNILFKAVK